MDGSPKKKALLALRKQLQALIASEEASDPAAAEHGHAEAAEVMDDMGSAEEKPQASDVQMKFMDYMKPKPKPRRPGTGLMMATATQAQGPAHKAPEKKMPGRPKREVG